MIFVANVVRQRDQDSLISDDSYPNLSSFPPRHWSLPMEILLPDQTTVDDIIFWTTELSNPENEKIARAEADANLNQWQAGDILCGSCG